ncbi:MAG: hypothetical protein AAGB26_04715 [Planctomycetota bacterium]
MKDTTTYAVCLVLLFLVTGCATKATINKPFDELQQEVQGMWRPQAQGLPLIINEAASDADIKPPAAHRDGDIYGVYKRPGFLYDTIDIKKDHSKTTYTVHHRFETSGAAVAWARTVVSIRRRSSDVTDVWVTAEEVGLVSSKRNRPREQWVLDYLD